MSISRANSASNILDHKRSNGGFNLHQSYGDLTEPVWRRRASVEFKPLNSVPPLPSNLLQRTDRKTSNHHHHHQHHDANYLIWITPVAARYVTCLVSLRAVNSFAN